MALDSVGSFLVELVLTLASVDTYRELCEELFQGRLLQFAVHPKANFVLQRLISNCEEKEMVIHVLFHDLTLLHSEQLQLYGVLAILSAIAGPRSTVGRAPDS